MSYVNGRYVITNDTIHLLPTHRTLCYINSILYAVYSPAPGRVNIMYSLDGMTWALEAQIISSVYPTRWLNQLTMCCDRDNTLFILVNFANANASQIFRYNVSTKAVWQSAWHTVRELRHAISHDGTALHINSGGNANAYYGNLVGDTYPDDVLIASYGTNQTARGDIGNHTDFLWATAFYGYAIGRSMRIYTSVDDGVTWTPVVSMADTRDGGYGWQEYDHILILVTRSSVVTGESYTSDDGWNTVGDILNIADYPAWDAFSGMCPTVSPVRPPGTYYYYDGIWYVFGMHRKVSDGKWGIGYMYRPYTTDTGDFSTWSDWVVLDEVDGADMGVPYSITPVDSLMGTALTCWHPTEGFCVYYLNFLVKKVHDRSFITTGEIPQKTFVISGEGTSEKLVLTGDVSF